MVSPEESLDTSSVTSSITKPGVSLTPPSPKSPEDTEHGTVLNNPLPLILQPSSPLTPLPDSLPPLDTSSQTIYSKVVENTSLFTSQFPENLSTDTVRKGTEGYGRVRNTTPYSPKGGNSEAVSVQRDFNKRPNSLERDVVPMGLFPGTTKILYDVLFQRTRGAKEPTRFMQTTSAALVKWARTSEKTLWRHLSYLERVGLVRRRTDLIQDIKFKKNGGNIYEIFVPEEIDLPFALTIAEESRLTTQSIHSFPQGNSREGNSTVRTKVPGTEGNNVPYTTKTNPLKSNTSEPLRHDNTRYNTEEESAASRLAQYVFLTFEEYLGRPLATEEKLAIFATLSEELLDLIHQGLNANAEHGQKQIENPVAWFTAMIGQRLTGRNRKRSPEESLRSAIWMELREIQKKRGGRITADERYEIEEELLQRLVPRFESRVVDTARFIKEHITGWWMNLH